MIVRHRQWYRFYSSLIRRKLAHRRRFAGAMPVIHHIGPETQLGLGQTLWRYFNAPGNVMFVTTNIVTFAGVVAYSTLVTASRERMFEERMAAVEATLKADLEGSEQLDTLPSPPPALDDWILTKIQEHETAARKIADAENTDSPFATYQKYEVGPKSNEMPTYNSQISRMSLYHLLYAYFIYKDVAMPQTQPRSESWQNEVNEISNNEPPAGRINMSQFYDSWRKEFWHIFTDLNKSQQFHIPNWSAYPPKLQQICKELSSNDMSSITDLEDLYAKTDSKELKTLLIRWIYDFGNLLKTSNGVEKEVFYNMLLTDSISDRRLFFKYSSIIVNPNNPRRSLFFDKDGYSQAYNISLTTWLNALEGFTKLRQVNAVECHDAIVKLISMLQKNSYIKRNSKWSTSASEVRLFLPVSQSGALVPRSPKESSRCYKLVSFDPKAVRLLQEISNWES